MIYECHFNPARDIQATVPDMSIDLKGAIETGVVLDTGMITESNGIENVASIVGRVHDAFDALEHQRAFVAAGKAKLAESAAANAAAAMQSAGGQDS